MPGKSHINKIGSRGIEKTLLWQNPSPTSNFAGQVFNFDIAGYDAFEVIIRYSTSNVAEGSSMIFKDISMGGTSVSATSVITDTCVGRSFYIKDGKLQCSKASYDTGLTTAIPVRIYGVKFGINFKVGNKTYIYKSGIWNENYAKTINGNIQFLSDRIKMNGDCTINITGLKTNSLVVMKSKQTYNLVSGAIAISLAAANTNMCASNPYNIELINAVNTLTNTSVKITSGNVSGIFEVYEIWTED